VAATDRSVWLATLADAEVEVRAPNRLLYRRALRGQLACDLSYTYRLDGLKKDVILRAALPDPAPWGLAPDDVLVQAVTEFVEAPEPVVTRRPAERGQEDMDLDFGPMQMAQGRALALGDRAERSQTRVAKQWVKVEGRTLLLESVRLEEMAAEWKRLTAAVAPPAGPQQLLAGAAGSIPPPSPSAAKPEAAPMQLARNDPLADPGFVLDWQLLSSQANVTLQGDTTYYVSGTANLSGTTTLEGGTVVKYAKSTAAKIAVSGPLLCTASPYRPAVFTAKDDNSVGETITGSTGTPTGYYANPAMQFSGAPPASWTLAHFRIAYAQQAVQASSQSLTLALRHGQIVHCAYGVAMPGQGTVRLQNCAAVFSQLNSWPGVSLPNKAHAFEPLGRRRSDGSPPGSSTC
jgi:hypothetical protein